MNFKRIIPVVLILIAASISGCTADKGSVGVEEFGDYPEESSDLSSESEKSDKTNSKSENGTKNGFEWPPIEQAKIRPGVYIGSSPVEELGVHGSCTANFIFVDSGNNSIFIGTAAHCATGGGGLGAEIPIEGAGSPGKLAYSSFLAMTENKEQDEGLWSMNDFALIRIAERDHQLVHPAMLHYGGPTDVGSLEEVEVGDRVYSYGKSSFHFGIEELQKREGFVTEKRNNNWSFFAHMITPGLRGDSGSPVTNDQGIALGVLVSGSAFPAPGSNGITSLEKALDYMHENSDLQVELATWEKLKNGTLPESSLRTE